MCVCVCGCTDMHIVIMLAAAPLWTAQCSYYTQVGARYAKLTNQSHTVVISRFFGIFFLICQLCKYSNRSDHIVYIVMNDNMYDYVDREDFLRIYEVQDIHKIARNSESCE